MEPHYHLEPQACADRLVSFPVSIKRFQKSHRITKEAQNMYLSFTYFYRLTHYFQSKCTDATDKKTVPLARSSIQTPPRLSRAVLAII